MHSLWQIIAREVIHESRKLKQARPESQYVDLLLKRACYSLTKAIVIQNGRIVNSYFRFHQHLLLIGQNFRAFMVDKCPVRYILDVCHAAIRYG